MANIADFGELSAGETALLTGLASGDTIVLDPDTGNEVRAALLRQVLLNDLDDLSEAVAGARVHEKGVRLAGARITGRLDLEGCRAPRDIALIDCDFEAAPVLRSAVIDNLFLMMSRIPGVEADRLELRGGLFLRDAVTSGPMIFLGATVGGNVDCSGAHLSGGDGKVALSLEGARIGGILFLRHGRIDGELHLEDAEVSSLCDAPDTWPASGNLFLNRFRYGSLTGAGLSSKERIAWLDRQDTGKDGADFWPQPWESCARVLRDMGYRDEARRVLIAKEKRHRAARRRRLVREGRIPGAAFAALGDTILAVTVRYGRVPLLAVVWLLAMWGAGTVIFSETYARDAFKPNNAFVLRSPEWAGCAPGVSLAGGAALNTGESQLACYLDQPSAASYPIFHAGMYALDTLLPIVALEMQGYWIPDESAPSPWGRFGRAYLWLHIVLGWAFSVLAVAGYSGLIKSD
ncbi:hypothetical protein [Maritimibacter sp. UBA3975]|uniref:hypothetical protein n=1 Tax=Maritimibacter sp. UBA3975 TaxID=1946833 RepID=UPI000C09BA32|nr:hypothetical protein [Maritimibacter sp. UBA3975]MAM60985.1 hypothetical protein [Maritimibacter sp.]|tara:strand:+ start:35186 stop:36571 length:1386 start_codon:yes stop_codon:yes gene_type:complete